jgi:pyruvate dehydrogenase E1 component alpha subunit
MPRTLIEPQFPTERLSILDGDGKLDAKLDPKLPPDDLKRLYRAMVLSRRLDERMLKLQRQGRIGTFAPIKGQEASQLGSVFTLKPTDWMCRPSVRRRPWSGAVGPSRILRFAGQLKAAAGAQSKRIPLTAFRVGPAAAQVGIARTAPVPGRTRWSWLFGDGDLQGDYTVATSASGVPVVFVTQNNQWVIGAAQKQTNSRTIAQEGLRPAVSRASVDGNDVLAVCGGLEAVARARSGHGPTLIECVTYRLGVHTTADDPTKYRTDEEVKFWEQKDPLTRFRAYLEKKKLLEPSLEDQVDEEIARAVERFEAMPPADPLAMFDHAYAELPPDLAAQRAELAARLEAPADGGEPASEERPSPPMRGQRRTSRWQN